MKTRISIILLILGVATVVHAQKYKIVKSEIVFFSEAPIEDITAINHDAIGIFNSDNNEIAIIVPVAKFEFDKELMKEHFNEKYMESEKFPRISFSGKVKGYNKKNQNKTDAVAEGKMSIHGVTKDIVANGTVQVDKNKLIFTSTFKIKLADYQIKIPQLMWQNIAEEIEITVYLELSPQ